MIVYEVVLQQKNRHFHFRKWRFFKASKLKCMNEVAMDAS